MKKKSIALLLCGMIAVFAVFISVRIVSATGISPRNILKSVNILGIGAVQPTSMKFQLLDGADRMENQSVILPTISGNDGMVYVVRLLDAGSFYATVNPQSGEKLEGQTDFTWYLGGGTGDESVTFVADSSTSSWWIMSQSSLIWNQVP